LIVDLGVKNETETLKYKEIKKDIEKSEIQNEVLRKQNDTTKALINNSKLFVQQAKYVSTQKVLVMEEIVYSSIY
ncbi:hypothetical protein HN451_06360, partial [archaeon]|nr:hypothetical protein [archaeon]